MDARNDGQGSVATVVAAAEQPPGTCAEAAERYLEHRLTVGGKSATTVDGERSGVRAFAQRIDAFYQGGVNDVQLRTWAFWRNWCEAHARAIRDTLSESTYATRVSQLRAFTAWCVGRGWGCPYGHRDDYDPWSNVEVPKPMPTEFRRLTPEELLRLLEAAPYPRDRIALAVAMNTGLRGKEIADLRVRDVDLKNKQLHVRITKTREIDAMPITADLELELRRWLNHYDEISPGDANIWERFLVPAQHVSGQTITYKPWTRVGEPHTIVARACQRAGLETDRDGFHTIRRSVARIYFDMIEAETSEDRALIATMTLLHHSRPETTLRYIGVDRQKQYRDDALRGRRFLTDICGEGLGRTPDATANVTELRRFSR